MGAGKKKHVLLYTEDPGEGGVAIYNHSILCGLAHAGYQVTCAQTKCDNPMLSKQKELGVKHCWLGFHTRLDSTRTVTNTADAEGVFNRTCPDIVLFTNCSPFSNLAAKMIAISRRIPFVIVEGYVAPFSEVSSGMAYCLRYMGDHYKQAKAVIAVSKENLGLLHQFYKLSPRKGEVIHYGRPAAYFEPRRPEVRARLRKACGFPKDAMVCLTIGRLEPVKGYHLQVEALKQLRGKDVWPRLYFAWAGAGSQEKQLTLAVQEFGAADHVRILGQCWDIPDWLDASDVFLLPTFCEGMPLSIMEAMAKGLPVAASAVSGIPEELGDTGKLLPAPTSDPAGTVREIVNTLESWTRDDELRAKIGEAGRVRANRLFREERMVHETIQVIERATLPAGDYISPGMEVVRPDACFPNMTAGNLQEASWKYLRKDVPHTWYIDRRVPHIGFLNRDEAHILYNTGLRFRGQRALEIGCWLGWSACHLALAGVYLDVIDPVLSRADFQENVHQALQAAGVRSSVNLVAGFSPSQVDSLSGQADLKWALFFIDGNHDAPYPVFDAAVCAEHAEQDALILFHDLASPEVAHGLEYLRQRGWNTMVYMTAQVMGVGWRGNAEPVQHVPDPDVCWHVPDHLRSFVISGLDGPKKP